MKYRVDEYINYHINGDADCNTKVLKYWADVNNLNEQERFDLSYFFSITYSIISAIIIFKEKEIILNNIDDWVENNKNKLIFQSDRKYVKMKDHFNKCIDFYKNNLNNKDVFANEINDKKIDIQKSLNKIQCWYLFGRFSAYLFLETFICLMDLDFENTSIDWLNGSTVTSGILNVFGLDNSANYFDKNNKLPKNIDCIKLDELLNVLSKEIKRKGGNNNITYIETSLCAYRKFFKGTRYNGYYLDRMLEELYLIKNINNNYEDEINKLFDIRKSLFDKKYLGELNNWKGIRKEAKKLYKDKGIIL